MSADNTSRIVRPAYLIAAMSQPKVGSSLKDYGLKCGPIFATYGAKPISIGSIEQAITLFEGNWPKNYKVSVVKFPSMIKLKQCFESEEYKGVKHLRTDITESYFSIAIEAS